MLAKKREWKIQVIDREGGTREVSLEKFLDIIFPRLKFTPSQVTDTRKAVDMLGQYADVPGHLVGLKGFVFRRIP